MKQLFIYSILLWLSIQSGNSQPTLRYQTCTNCPNATGNMVPPLGGFVYSPVIQNMQSSHVSSDFGRRESDSKWHLGVDISPQAGDADMGDAIFPVETGTVILLNGNSDYKVLVIRGEHIFGYGHIFFNGYINSGLRSGDFILKRLDAPNDGHFAIINLRSNTAISDITIPATVTHPDANNGAPIAVTNQVDNLNVPIAPIGDSGGDFSAHIHLYCFETPPNVNDFNSSFTTGYPVTRFRNPKDPMEFLAHQAPNYSVNIMPFTWAYPGSNFTPIKVRCYMRNQGNGAAYSGAAMDLERVDLQIKRPWADTADYRDLLGRKVSSFICDGSKINSERYPSYGFPAHNTVAGFWEIADPNQRGSMSRMGVDGVAYRIAAYDDYYFTDIYSRINKLHNPAANNPLGNVNAMNNWQARYPDGPYELRAKAFSVTDAVFYSNDTTTTIDNFTPYIESFQVQSVNAQMTMNYKREIHPNALGLLTVPQAPNFMDEPADVNNDLFITITASEPLNPVSLILTNDQNLPYLNSWVDLEGRNYTFQISSVELLALPANVSVINFVVTAQDYSGNALIDLELMTGYPLGITLPVRSGANTWAPVRAGVNDNLHYVRLNGCTRPRPRPNGERPAPVEIVFVQSESSNGACDGAIDLSPGAQGPMTYLWSNGATTEDVSGLCAGDYSVTVFFENGCERVLYATVGTCRLTFQKGQTADCATGLGDLTPTFSGCGPSLNYLWSTGATTPGLSNVPFGDYGLTVTCPTSGCSTSTQFNLQGSLVVMAQQSPAPCAGANNASIQVQVAGGTGNYGYFWTNGGITDRIRNLSPGWYSVTVYDEFCTAEAGFAVTERAPISINVASLVAACPGQMNGAATVIAGGGIAPYQYQWSNGQSGASLHNAMAGAYALTVTDSYGCTQSATVEIPLSQPIQLNLMPTPTCPNANNGGVHVFINGGTSPYLFIWSNGATTHDINNLQPGPYSLTVSDASGCFQTATTQVAGLAPAGLSAQPRPVCGADQATGAIDLSVNGAVQPIQYIWNNGANTQDLNGLYPGNYTVTVSDGLGCSLSATFTVPVEQIQIIPSVNPACGGQLGHAQVSATGGTAPYSYGWNVGQTSQGISYPAGTYQVYAQDALGCIATATVTIPTAPGIGLAVDGSDACAAINDGVATVSVNGGTYPVSFYWGGGVGNVQYNGNSTQATGLSPGSIYTITVTDANNCTVSASVAIGFASVTTAPDVFDCRYTNEYCHGTQIDHYYTGEEVVVDPEDCEWSNLVCVANGEIITYHYQHNPTIPIENWDNCSVDYRCPNGDISYSEEGLVETTFEPGLSYQHSCAYVRSCLLPNGNSMITSIEYRNNGSIQYDYESTACEPDLFANYYCEGIIVGSLCVPVSLTEPSPISRSSGANPLAAYPNPFQGYFEVSLAFMPEGQCSLMLMNTLGQVFVQETFAATKDNFQRKVTVPEGLPQGQYIVQLQLPNGQLKSLLLTKVGVLGRP